MERWFIEEDRLEPIPLPRLLFADWCDENDQPFMSIVQRRLVLNLWSHPYFSRLADKSGEV
jgi:hypothetical protein